MNNQLFEQLCSMTQTELKQYVYNELVKNYGKKNVFITNNSVKSGFVFAYGKVPVLLLAHLDTVHKEPPKLFVYSSDKNIVASPQGIGGDDRCGVYMILDIIKTHKCSVLFCEDEELGCLGADTFTDMYCQVCEQLNIEDMEYNYLLEFDRANSNDAVFYDCENKDFESFVTSQYYKSNYGSFTDISVVAPFLCAAAVNLSCGYYKAHTTDEYVVLSEMEKNIESAKQILDRTKIDKDIFEYISSMKSSYSDVGYIIEYGDDNKCDVIFAESKSAAIGEFLMDHPSLRYCDIHYILE